MIPNVNLQLLKQNLSILSFAIDNIKEAVFLSDKEGDFLYVNDEACRMLGYEKNEILSLNVKDINPNFDMAKWANHWNQLKEKKSITFEDYNLKKDNSLFPVDVTANYFNYDGLDFDLALVLDISERKENERKYQSYLDFLTTMDVINQIIQSAHNLDKMLNDVLGSMADIFQCDGAWLLNPFDTMNDKTLNISRISCLDKYKSIFSKINEIKILVEDKVMFQTLLASKDSLTFGFGNEYATIPNSFSSFGIKSMISISLYPKIGKPWLFSLYQIGIERIWTEEEKIKFNHIGKRLCDSLSTFLYNKSLTQNEDMYKKIIENSSEGIMVIDPTSNVIYANARMTEMLGYSKNELVNKKTMDLVIQEDLEDHYLRMKNRHAFISENYERRLRRKDGSIIWTSISGTPLLGDKGKYNGTFSVFSDITDRKNTENQLIELNRFYKTLTACNEALVRAKDEIELLNTICQILVDVGGYKMVWVGYRQYDDKKSVEPVAYAGKETDYIKHVSVSWGEDTENGKGPTGKAIRSGQVEILNYSEPFFDYWKIEANKHGFVSSTALPITINNETIGTFNIYSDSPINFGTTELKLFKDLVNDLAYGIESLRNKLEQNTTMILLNEAQRIGHIGIWEIKLPTNEFTRSEELKRIFEINPESDINSLDSYINLIHPQDRDSVNSYFYNSLTSHSSHSLEHRLLLPGGKIKFIRVEYENFYDDEDNPIRVAGTFQDITESKLAEEERLANLKFIEDLNKINNAMHSSNDFDELLGNVLDQVLIIFNCDKTSLISPCDPDSMTFRLICERNKEKYPRKAKLNIDYPMTDDLAQMIRIICASDSPVQFRSDDVYAIPFDITNMFGVQSYLAMTINPKIGKPMFFGISQCASNYTWKIKEIQLFEEIGRRIEDWLSTVLFHQELKRLNQNLEERVLERTSQLQKVNKGLRIFSYSISHDLRVPLNHINSYLELIKEKIYPKLDDEEKQYFSHISKFSKEMNQLIDDILLFSKVNHEEMIYSTVDLNILVQNTVNDFKPELTHRKVIWKIKNLPVIKADENLIHLVFMNLISNALKFTRKREETKITIGYLSSELENTIYVRDNGVGFNMQHRNKLFNAFQRLHSTADFEGTGIGLVSVKKIISRHGGEIWAEGILNEGATFYFSLPK